AVGSSGTLASAGPGGRPPGTPAVAGPGGRPSGTPAVYGSRQLSVALTAPGQQVTAASPTGYQTMSRPGAASAIRAGVVALVRSGFPALTATQVTDALMDSAGRRVVNAEGAITNAMTMAPPGAKLAMKGALPRTNPATPLVPSLGSSIRADLIRDGI